jgi:hypothetical protein
MTTGLMRAHTSICVFSGAAFEAAFANVFAGFLRPVLADGNFKCIGEDNDQ